MESRRAGVGVRQGCRFRFEWRQATRGGDDECIHNLGLGAKGEPRATLHPGDQAVGGGQRTRAESHPEADPVHRALRQQHPFALDTARSSGRPHQQAAELDVPQLGHDLHGRAADPLQYALRHLDRPGVGGLEPVDVLRDGCAHVDAGDGLGVIGVAVGRPVRQIGSRGEGGCRGLQPGPPGIGGLGDQAGLGARQLLDREVIQPDEGALGRREYPDADGAAGRAAHRAEPAARPVDLVPGDHDGPGGSCTLDRLDADSAGGHVSRADRDESGRVLGADDLCHPHVEQAELVGAAEL